jgi:Concanavalin A-like lectin/glucanases superfamily/Peptide-N-glycosidase F, C terminal/Secretion system C-terminal sorting domain
MKKILLLVQCCLLLTTTIIAQNIGDTIVVQSFNYSQTYGVGIRDTVISFPDNANLSFERILMSYNMRCKKGITANNSTPQSPTGCGEWDYSCNTYIVDSNQVDSVKARGPSHTISGFKGSIYPYQTAPTYSYYQYLQKNNIHTNTISETSATIGNGNSSTNLCLHTNLQNGKSQYLWTAAELTNAGLVPGNISGLQLSISNAGSDAQFLKIKLKHTIDTLLNAAKPQQGNFLTCYFANTTFTNGLNNFNFFKNFNWNGVDNIVVEFSFSNATIGNDNIVLSDNNNAIMGLSIAAPDLHFVFDGNNKIIVDSSKFSSISNQLSICFWANGNPTFLPANTSILEGVNATGNRSVNMHLPWSNGSIYFDCGSNATGGYDRINKAATITNFAGVWNHWAFTKNSTSGVMNAYLNGVLWHTGTAKTMPIQITKLFIGNGVNNNNSYFGKVDDISIWNTELSASTINNWMNKKIDATHPNYNNLQYYFLCNEGIGNVSVDSSIVFSSSTIVNTGIWMATKGQDLFKNFVETSQRPLATFLQGVYAQSTITNTVLDSVMNNQNTVSAYTITNNNYVLQSINNYYPAGFQYVYNGDSTSQLLDSIYVAPVGIVTITTLPYYIFTPAKLQIMSFVTPYGNGLNMGVNGKTWMFDVSDFAPILKGNKRMTMDAGGQWQEDMDIKFLFIVGTPPRTVTSLQNIWRTESVDFANINNNNYFEPRSLYINQNTKYTKVRNVISGHGQEGEFIPRQHHFNINNGAPEFNWTVAKACAENPVYPQGGTWVYDRAGWCPGMATDMQELDATPFATAGTNVLLDYDVDVATGDSRYIVSNQLVQYSAANFANDAAIVDVKSPSNKIEYARTNAICAQPIITIQNTGSTALTSAKIEYWINNNTNKQIFNWVGNLAFMQTVDVTLPYNDAFWAGVQGALGNVFHANITMANNVTDDYSFNNLYNSPFDITGVLPNKFSIWLRTNNVATENNYVIKNGNGDTVFIKNNLVNNFVYKDTFNLPLGCYQLVLSDAGEDGLAWWANTAAGNGYCNIRNATGGTVKTINPDFGKSVVYNFTIDFPLHYDAIFPSTSITIFPNPATDIITVDGNSLQLSSLQLTDQLGNILNCNHLFINNKLQVNVANLPVGVYFISMQSTSGNTIHAKFMKQ